ncbi:hypothetical protein ACLOJK_024954 [Asimina triloba]
MVALHFKEEGNEAFVASLEKEVTLVEEGTLSGGSEMDVLEDVESSLQYLVTVDPQRRRHIDQAGVGIIGANRTQKGAELVKGSNTELVLDLSDKACLVGDEFKLSDDKLTDELVKASVEVLR